MKRSTKNGDCRLMQGSASGFSLIELLIVVAIILVIAAIAIPNLIRAKAAANDPYPSHRFTLSTPPKSPTHHSIRPSAFPHCWRT